MARRRKAKGDNGSKPLNQTSQDPLSEDLMANLDGPMDVSLGESVAESSDDTEAADFAQTIDTFDPEDAFLVDSVLTPEEDTTSTKDSIVSEALVGKKEKRPATKKIKKPDGKESYISQDTRLYKYVEITIEKEKEKADVTTLLEYHNEIVVRDRTTKEIKNQILLQSAFIFQNTIADMNHKIFLEYPLNSNYTTKMHAISDKHISAYRALGYKIQDYELHQNYY